MSQTTTPGVNVTPMPKQSHSMPLAKVTRLQDAFDIPSHVADKAGSS